MTFTYQGSELDVFSNAINWKRYVGTRLSPFVTGDVLEVGSGIGSVTRALCNGRQHRWVCLEPDAGLSLRARQELKDLAVCEFVVGTTADLPEQELFDAVLYMDVLEHLEDDRSELRRVSQHLRPAGVICVLAPAHNFLFSEFDRAIGHYRRYNRSLIERATLEGMNLELLLYLDSCGLMASLANRLLLRSANPTRKQIIFWDRVLVRCSQVIDPILQYSIGKSILAVWRSST